MCNDAYLEDGIPAYSAMSQVKEARIFFPPGPSCERKNMIAYTRHVELCTELGLHSQCSICTLSLHKAFWNPVCSDKGHIMQVLGGHRTISLFKPTPMTH